MSKSVHAPTICVVWPRIDRAALSTEPADIALEENDVLTQFEALGLDVRALNAVARMELEKPTDVQREAIPPFMRGRDVVATAPTGTGKTLAFSLPIVEKFLREDEEENNTHLADVQLHVNSLEAQAHIKKDLDIEHSHNVHVEKIVPKIHAQDLEQIETIPIIIQGIVQLKTVILAALFAS